MALKAPAGAPTWMVTFADLMALLLTLFVLLLTFAEMDVKKYKQIAGALSDAFGVAKEDRLAGMIELDGSHKRKFASQVSREDRKIVRIEGQSEEEDEEAKEDEERERERKRDRLHKLVRRLIEQEIANAGVSVDRDEGSIVVRFPDRIAFHSGSDRLSDQLYTLLDKLAPALARVDGQILIGGHTDDVPVSGGRYRSNWGLSAARATAVVHRLLEVSDIDPGRVTVQGFADSRPLKPNDSPENRAANRRVEITIITE